MGRRNNDILAPSFLPAGAAFPAHSDAEPGIPATEGGGVRQSNRRDNHSPGRIRVTYTKHVSPGCRLRLQALSSRLHAPGFTLQASRPRLHAPGFTPQVYIGVYIYIERERERDHEGSWSHRLSTRCPFILPRIMMPRLKTQGSTKRYSTWTCETLNIILRRVSSAMHSLRMESRVHAAFALIGRLKLDRWIFGR